VILEGDIDELIDQYFEETVLSLQDQDLSELSRQMAAFFLIEKAYKYLATEAHGVTTSSKRREDKLFGSNTLLIKR
jgi:hypothetical protein